MSSRLFSERAPTLYFSPKRRRWRSTVLSVLVLVLVLLALACLCGWLWSLVKTAAALPPCGWPLAVVPSSAAAWVAQGVLFAALVGAVVLASRKMRQHDAEGAAAFFEGALEKRDSTGRAIVFMPFDETSHAMRAAVDELESNQRVLAAAKRTHDLDDALDALAYIHRRNAVTIEVLQTAVAARTGNAARVPVLLLAADGWNDAVWGVWALVVIGVAGIAALAFLLVHVRRNARFVEDLRRSQIERKAAHIAARRRDVEGASTVEVASGPSEVLPFTVGPLECLSEPFHVAAPGGMVPEDEAPPADFFTHWKLDEVSRVLGTGFFEFDTVYGLSGLAKMNGDTLEVLAVVAHAPGKGAFRSFIAAAQKRFTAVAVLNIWEPLLERALDRYGFDSFSRTEPGGEVITGMVWRRPDSRASCPHPQCKDGWLVYPDDPLAEGPCVFCGRFFESCKQEGGA